MSNEIGYVSLAVIPTFKGASASLSRELQSSGAGTSAGKITGAQYGKAFSTEVVRTGGKATQSVFDQAGKGATSAGLGLGRRAGLGITKGLGEYAKVAASTVAGFFAFEKAKQFVTAAITGASDLAESANKIQVVFGSAEDQVLKFATTADTALGQSELQARNAAATFGVFGKSGGLAGKDLADFSIRLDKLAGDMASFSNTSPEQAIEALGAGLRGESEPLRAYGVLLDDATLRQKALKLGLVDTTTHALTPQQRVLSAYQVILDQTGDAQGDFSRTSDGLANQQRILSAEFTNLEASVGKGVLPVLTTATQILTQDVIPAISTLDDVGHGVVDVFHALPGPMRDTVVVLGALYLAQKLASTQFAQNTYLNAAVGVETLGKKYTALSTSIRTANIRGAASKGAFGAAGIGLLTLSSRADEANHSLGVLTSVAGSAALGFAAGGPWGAAIGGGVGLLSAFTGGSDDAASSVESFTGSLDENTGAITKNTRELVANDLQKNGTFDLARKNGIALDLVTDAALGQKAAIAELGRIYDLATPTTAHYGDELKRTGGVVDEIALQHKAYGEQATDAALEIDKVRTAVGVEGDALKESRVAWDQLQEAVNGHATAQGHSILTTAQASRVNAQLGESLLSTKADADAYRGEIDRAEQATRNATKAEDDLYDAIVRLDNRALGVRGALSNYAASIDEVTTSLKENGHSLDINSEKGRANRAALDAVAQSALDAESHMSRAARVTFNNDAHDKLVDLAVQFTGNRKAAENYADRVLGKVVPALDTAKTHLDDTRTSAENLGKEKPNVEVTADTTDARSNLDRFVRDANTALSGIQDEPVVIALTAQASKVAAQLGVPGLRDGGSVYGPGGPRGDKIPAMLSDGERVNAAHIVTRAGRGNNRRGQQVFEAFERMILRGELGRFGDIPAFADGGPVVVPNVAGTGLSSAVAMIDQLAAMAAAAAGRVLSGLFSDKLTHLPTAGQLGPGGSLTPAQLARGQQAASSQVGKPYIWGGVGPEGYDCSGFQSYVLNSALGLGNPYFRRGSTASMPWPGSGPGAGRYSIGWTPNWSGGIGHTSGNIGGLNVESYGGHGPAVGSGARSPLDPHFTGLMHYRDGGPVFKADTGGFLRPGMNHVFNGTGRNEEIPDPRGGHTQKDVVAALGDVARRIGHLEETLVSRGVLLRDPKGTLAAGARRVARTEDAADARHDDRLERMGTPRR